MAIIGTNDTATVRVASLPSGAAFDNAANVTIATPTGFSATTAQAFINELTDGTVATNVNADLLDGVHGSNYARTDVAETFTQDIYVEGGTVYIDATAGSNSRVILRNEANISQGQLYWDRFSDRVNLIRWNAAASIIEGFFSIGATDVTYNNNAIWHAGNDVQHRSFTVGTVPSASSSGAGTMIYVSNESGGAVPAFSDGTNWRRVTDRATIS